MLLRKIISGAQISRTSNSTSCSSLQELYTSPDRYHRKLVAHKDAITRTTVDAQPEGSGRSSCCSAWRPRSEQAAGRAAHGSARPSERQGHASTRFLTTLHEATSWKTEHAAVWHLRSPFSPESNIPRSPRTVGQTKSNRFHPGPAEPLAAPRGKAAPRNQDLETCESHLRSISTDYRRQPQSAIQQMILLTLQRMQSYRYITKVTDLKKTNFDELQILERQMNLLKDLNLKMFQNCPYSRFWTHQGYLFQTRRRDL